MTRDTSSLVSRRFDVLIVGGGIHGLTLAYDAAQRGLTTALIERGDFGGGSSFNHAKTVHGGLRSLQTGDLPKARFSMRERRAMARIAPNYVAPLSFMMATTSKLMRSRMALTAGFAVDAIAGYDRNRGVVPCLHLPAGRVVSRDSYRSVFGDNASPSATGGASWCDYQMPESDRLTLAFAQAAVGCGAVLANYVDAFEPVRAGRAVAGMKARDLLSGAELVIDARLVINAAGAFSGRWMAALGGRMSFPLIKAMNVVTSRLAVPPALGAPTDGGRLLLIMPWQGRGLIGTSHSESPVDPAASSVSDAELSAFITEINSAFPALALTSADVTLVHRGVVPAERQRDGRLGLMGHHRVYDHAGDGVDGALSVVGVKYTTARGVAEQVIDRALEKLGRPRVACRTGVELLPGAFARPVADEVDEARRGTAGMMDAEMVPGLIRTHGAAWRDIADLCRMDPALAAPVSPNCAVPIAVLLHAVRQEMARTLTDVVVRRSGIGAAGYPGDEAANACARALAPGLGWDEARVAEELAELKAFYAPVTA